MMGAGRIFLQGTPAETMEYLRPYRISTFHPVKGSCRTGEPVSSRDFRLEMTIGQAPDTATMKFEGSRSMVWVMESLTAGPLGSSSIVQRDSSSALSSGLF